MESWENFGKAINWIPIAGKSAKCSDKPSGVFSAKNLILLDASNQRPKWRLGSSKPRHPHTIEHTGSAFGQQGVTQVFLAVKIPKAGKAAGYD